MAITLRLTLAPGINAQIDLANVPQISAATKLALDAIAPSPKELCSLKQRALNLIEAQNDAFVASQRTTRNKCVGAASFLLMSSLVTGTGLAAHYLGSSNPGAAAGIIVPLTTAQVGLGIKFIHMITKGRLNVCNVFTSVIFGTIYPLVWGFGSEAATASIQAKKAEAFIKIWKETLTYLRASSVPLHQRLQSEAKVEFLNLITHFSSALPQVSPIPSIPPQENPIRPVFYPVQNTPPHISILIPTELNPNEEGKAPS